jgi:hypothetical protein
LMNLEKGWKINPCWNELRSVIKKAGKLWNNHTWFCGIRWDMHMRGKNHCWWKSYGKNMYPSRLLKKASMDVETLRRRN